MNRKKILCIDDSDDTLDLLEIFLYKQYEIITAQNGFDGLNKAEEYSPDCIITDIIMPVMDGIKFYNSLKKNEIIANIPVIAITSFVKKMSTKSLLSIGFRDVITKPLRHQIVLEKVDAVLQAVKN